MEYGIFHYCLLKEFAGGIKSVEKLADGIVN